MTTKKSVNRKRKPIYTDKEAEMLVRVSNLAAQTLDLVRMDCVRFINACLDVSRRNPYALKIKKKNPPMARIITEFERDLQNAIEVLTP